MFTIGRTSKPRRPAGWRFPRGARRAPAFALYAALAVLPLADLAVAGDRVLLDPVQDPELSALLEQNFSLPMLVNPAGAPVALDEAEIEAEQRRLTGLLKAFGHLDARVTTRGDGTEASPLRFAPVPGPLYRIGQISFFFEGVAPGTPDELLQTLALFRSEYLGKVAAEDILEQMADFVELHLRERSYFQAAVEVFPLRTDPDSGTAAISVAIAPGDPVAFGSVHFTGSFRMDDEQAQALVPFEPGDPYTASAVESLYASLDQTGMFRRIRIETAQAPDDRGRVDVEVDLRDIAPDPAALAQTGGDGPMLLLLTMFMLVLMESIRVTSLWSHAVLRRAISIPVIVMVVTSCRIVFERLHDFLV